MKKSMLLFVILTISLSVFGQNPRTQNANNNACDAVLKLEDIYTNQSHYSRLMLAAEITNNIENGQTLDAGLTIPIVSKSGMIPINASLFQKNSFMQHFREYYEVNDVRSYSNIYKKTGLSDQSIDAWFDCIEQHAAFNVDFLLSEKSDTTFLLKHTYNNQVIKDEPLSVRLKSVQNFEILDENNEPTSSFFIEAPRTYNFGRRPNPDKETRFILVASVGDYKEEFTFFLHGKKPLPDVMENKIRLFVHAASGFDTLTYGVSDYDLPGVSNPITLWSSDKNDFRLVARVSDSGTYNANYWLRSYGYGTDIGQVSSTTSCISWSSYKLRICRLMPWMGEDAPCFDKDIECRQIE